MPVLDFQKRILGPAGPQLYIFGRQNKYSCRQKLHLIIMEYNKLSIFYLALTEKKCFRPPFELSCEWFLLVARLPAGVRENEPPLKRKSPQTGFQA